MSGNRRKHIWRRTIIASVVVALVVFGSPVCYLVYQRWTFAANIQKLNVGESKERVEELLGAPRWRFAKGSQITDVLRKQNLLVWLFVPESPETWVYGSWRLLWLAPAEDDYAIEFDDAGCVSRIVFPHENTR